MKPKAAVGTVIEIPTSKGLAYAQYVLWHSNWGALIRVLPGFHPARPADLDRVVRQTHLYVTFYPLASYLKDGSVTSVGRFEIPPGAEKLPLFRHDFPWDREGHVVGRRLWDGDKEWWVAVSVEHDRLPLLRVPFHGAFVQGLELGWTPERDEEIRVAQLAKNPPLTGPPTRAAVTHRLYFVDRVKAESAAQSLRGPGRVAKVTRAGDGAQWLVEMTVGPEDSTEAESAAETAARQFGGEYDGRETELNYPGASGG